MSGTRDTIIVYPTYSKNFVHPMLNVEWYYTHKTRSIAMKCSRCVKDDGWSYMTTTKYLRLDAFCHLCGWCPAEDGLDNIPLPKTKD
jgi:hypothetical protein